MASGDFRKFACSVCKHVNYQRRRNQKKGVQQEKIETTKFCKFCRKHQVHKEVK
jgi:large subunit ribosomal protein L33